MTVKLQIPFCEQKSDSGACGPCCLKMVLDAFGKKRNGKQYTKMSLVRLARTSAETGTSYFDMIHTLQQAGLYVDRIRFKEQVIASLAKGNPVIACVQDPGPWRRGEKVEEFHYVVIKGFEVRNGLFGGLYLCYDDPYYGPDQNMRIDRFFSMMGVKSEASFRWMVEVSRA